MRTTRLPNPYRGMNDDANEFHRYAKLVPFAFTHIVCTCTMEERQRAFEQGKRTGKKIETLDGDFRTCNNCDKYPRYLVRRCSTCDEPFVKCFRVSGECSLNPMCWPCIMDMHMSTWTKCTDYPEQNHDNCYKGQSLPPKDRDLTLRERVTAETLEMDLSEFNFEF